MEQKEFTVYVLQSELNGRHYIGHIGDIKTRLKAHNSGKVRSTKAYRPWKLVYYEEHPNKQSAYKREMVIKGFKGGDYLQDSKIYNLYKEVPAL